MLSSHIKIIRLHSYDLFMWILLLLYVRVGIERRTSMQHSITFKLFVKSSLGHLTSWNVLWNKFTFISSLFEFLKLCRSTTCHSSNTFQFIVYNDNLPNHNRRIYLLNDIILFTNNNIFDIGILVSSLKRAMQQSRLLSYTNNSE